MIGKSGEPPYFQKTLSVHVVSSKVFYFFERSLSEAGKASIRPYRGGITSFAPVPIDSLDEIWAWLPPRQPFFVIEDACLLGF